jgi:hypothetical protein
MMDQNYSSMGFIRARRHEDGYWRFEFPYAEPGTVGWDFLEMVARNISKFIRVIGKESQRSSISS